jgi:cytochrome c553
MKKILEAAGNRLSALLSARVVKGLAIVLGAGLIAVHAAAQQSRDTIAQRTAACAACHGKEGRATSDGYFPRIAGKPAGYLYNQLINFREGRRRYPMMTYMVDHLSDAYLSEMAQYFANLHLPYPAPQAVDVPAATLERGKALVLSGDASKNIPACVACHGKNLTGVAPAIPGLLGLPRDYLNSQFGAWKNGGRRAAAPDCMAQISNRLSAEDISAATAWLASQPVPVDTRPASPASIKLPLRCGTVSQ